LLENEADLFMDGYGRVYAGSGSFLGFVGENAEAAIEVLCSISEIKTLPKGNT
jgi:hypothetical protein